MLLFVVSCNCGTKLNAEESQFSVAEAVSTEISKWTNLFEQIQSTRIDFSKYPEELTQFQESYFSSLNLMMVLIEQAEEKDFEGQPYDNQLREFDETKRNLQNIKELFDDYKTYIDNNPLHESINVESIKNMTINRKMHISAFNIVIGSKPISIEETPRLSGKLIRCEYEGMEDSVYFLNEKFYKMSGSHETRRSSNWHKLKR